MPAKRAESPSHGTASAPLVEAPPSIVSDLIFLTELLDTARGQRPARPASASAMLVGESTVLNASSSVAGSQRSVNRPGAAAPPVHDDMAPLAVPTEMTEEEVVWQLTTALLRCREARPAPATGTATTATAASGGRAAEEAPQAYWTDLALQIRVDQLVEAVRYCADRGFSPLKASHVLAWWLRYDALVRSGADGDLIRPPPAATVGAVEAATALSPSSTSPSSSRGTGSANNASASGRKTHSARTTSGLGSSAESPKTAVAPADVATESPEVPAQPYLTVLESELRAFATEEVTSWWRWELVPRQPKERDRALAAALGNTSASGPGSAGPGKKKMSEKTRLLLQMEEEEEERRLAAVASLPAENIYLSESEVEAAVAFFVQRGWLAHAHLHRLLACRQRPTPHASRSPSLCPTFDVVVEQPMPVPMLATAHMSAARTGAAPEPALQTTFAPSVAGPHATVPPTATNASVGRPPAGPTPGKTRSRSSTSTKKPELNVRSRTTSELVDEEKAATDSQEETGTLSPWRELRAQQEAELAMLERQYAESCADTTEAARLRQLEEDMTLHFDREGTSKAVDDVYMGLEGELTEREMRILQRVEALELTLGMRAAPAEEAEVPAPAGKPSSRGTGSKRGGSQSKK